MGDPISGGNATPRKGLGSAGMEAGIWMSTWQIAGLFLPTRPNRRLLGCEFGTESILIIRQDTRDLRGLLQLLPATGGTAGRAWPVFVPGTLTLPPNGSGRITCPYHGWHRPRRGNVGRRTQRG